MLTAMILPLPLVCPPCAPKPGGQGWPYPGAPPGGGYGGVAGGGLGGRPGGMLGGGGGGMMMAGVGGLAAGMLLGEALDGPDGWGDGGGLGDW